MQTLLSGYYKIISTIYAPKQYYERVVTFLKSYQPAKLTGFRLRLIEFFAFIKSLILIGLREKDKRYYWKLLLWTLFKKPRCFHMSVTLSIYGFHFRKIVENYNKLVSNVKA